jgi:RNA polymerase sigma-70 factor (ECF subfamily)
MKTQPQARAGLADADDDQLVDLARQRDETAVRLLIKRHNQRLFRTARSVVRNDAEAEDVVQAAYVKAFTHLDGFRGEAQFSTWLTRITLNEAIARLRRRRPTTDIETLDRSDARSSAEIIQFPSMTPMLDPETEMSRGEVREILERAVDELPQGFRSVFVLRDVHGLSIEETASQLALKPETVRTRLHRARKMLRLAIETRLAGAFSSLFPFDGARCANMADRVLGELSVARW